MPLFLFVRVGALYSLIDKEKPKGIGALTIYDTAIRIGAKRKLNPNKIYLHAGTTKGLMNLFPKIKAKETFEINPQSRKLISPELPTNKKVP